MILELACPYCNRRPSLLVAEQHTVDGVQIEFIRCPNKHCKAVVVMDYTTGVKDASWAAVAATWDIGIRKGGVLRDPIPAAPKSEVDEELLRREVHGLAGKVERVGPHVTLLRKDVNDLIGKVNRLAQRTTVLEDACLRGEQRSVFTGVYVLDTTRTDGGLHELNLVPIEQMDYHAIDLTADYQGRERLVLITNGDAANKLARQRGGRWSKWRVTITEEKA